MVSCSSIEDPEPEPKYLELAGTWTGGHVHGYIYANLTIDDNGNITVVNSISSYTKLTFAGKIEDNFEYPYTVNLTQTEYNGRRLEATDYHHTNRIIIFSNASNCAVFQFSNVGSFEKGGYIQYNFKKN